MYGIILFTALLVALYGVSGEIVWLVGLVDALAAAIADTRATEVGVLALIESRNSDKIN